MPNSRMEILMRDLPSAVEIAASERAPVVSVDHSVWIQHWKNLENKLLSEHLSLLVIRIGEEEEDASHHP